MQLKKNKTPKKPKPLLIISVPAQFKPILFKGQL